MITIKIMSKKINLMDHVRTKPGFQIHTPKNIFLKAIQGTFKKSG